MGKIKNVRVGKVVKKKDELDDTKFYLSIKQHGKLSGTDSRKLKSAIEETIQNFLTEKYNPVVSQNWEVAMNNEDMHFSL